MIDPEVARRLTERTADWRWRPNPPASPVAIGRLIRAAPVRLPRDYLELLSLCDGGEGSLALPPLWLELWNAEFAAAHGFREEWPGFFAFAGNGGGETIAFDLASEGRAPIVAFDANAGVESVQRIAPDLATFLEAVGAEEPEER